MRGMDYEKKSFSVPMGGSAVEMTPKDIEERDQLKAERDAEYKRIQEQTKKHLNNIANQKVTRKLVPYGNRILVKRRKVEDRSSHIILPDEVKNLPTDIADVIEVPEQTLVDRALLANSQTIIDALLVKANAGDAIAVKELRDFKDYLILMTTKPGDVLLMARYGGTDFLIQETNQTLCVTDHNGIYARVIEKKG